MVSVCYSRSVLHQNRVQESVLELLPGIALEKAIERGGVLACPREWIHPSLVPRKSPRGSELGEGADHLAAFFRPAA